MDEQRFGAYLELIQALLSCPQGQEMALLQENAALVARCLHEGLLMLEGDVLRLTPAGFTVCDEICTELT